MIRRPWCSIVDCKFRADRTITVRWPTSVLTAKVPICEMHKTMIKKGISDDPRD